MPIVSTCLSVSLVTPSPFLSLSLCLSNFLVCVLLFLFTSHEGAIAIAIPGSLVTSDASDSAKRELREAGDEMHHHELFALQLLQL